MMTDITRTFFTKLVLICVALLAVNYFLIKPKVLAAKETAVDLEAQVSYIEHGQQDIEAHHDELEQQIDQMRVVRDEMIRDLESEQTAQAHQILQRQAISQGLVVTRIEPLKSVIEKTTPADEEHATELDVKEFRLECRGAFHDVIAFVSEVQSGEHQGCITSFRMVPIDERNVRVSMQIRLIELITIPDQIRDAFKGTEAITLQGPSEGAES
ncbi:MAG: hypothetical protein ACF8MF_07250 [Phycisphaerales bacterium JB052]